jgi:hypothetical protein
MKAFLPLAAALALAVGTSAALAQTTTGGGSMMDTMSSTHDRYGGPTYMASPDLQATISFVVAGGGPTNFSTAKALTALVGADLTTAEVGKLTKQYGKANVDSFITVFNYAVDDAAAIAIKDGVKFPQPMTTGHELAAQVVKDGTTPDGVFWTGYMLDHLVTHPIHDQVMGDIDKKFSPVADANYHKISNQAMYDLAQALGAKSVALASFH